ncbi:hypothetical protein P9112_004306 [Eukaryota sp. TZLM1-RC]
MDKIFVVTLLLGLSTANLVLTLSNVFTSPSDPIDSQFVVPIDSQHYCQTLYPIQSQSLLHSAIRKGYLHHSHDLLSDVLDTSSLHFSSFPPGLRSSCSSDNLINPNFDSSSFRDYVRLRNLVANSIEFDFFLTKSIRTSKFKPFFISSFKNFLISFQFLFEFEELFSLYTELLNSLNNPCITTIPFPEFTFEGLTISEVRNRFSVYLLFTVFTHSLNLYCQTSFSIEDKLNHLVVELQTIQELNNCFVSFLIKIVSEFKSNFHSQSPFDSPLRLHPISGCFDASSLVNLNHISLDLLPSDFASKVGPAVDLFTSLDGRFFIFKPRSARDALVTKETAELVFNLSSIHHINPTSFNFTSLYHSFVTESDVCESGYIYLSFHGDCYPAPVGSFASTDGVGRVCPSLNHPLAKYTGPEGWPGDDHGRPLGGSCPFVCDSVNHIAALIDKGKLSCVELAYGSVSPDGLTIQDCEVFLTDFIDPQLGVGDLCKYSPNSLFILRSETTQPFVLKFQIPVVKYESPSNFGFSLFSIYDPGSNDYILFLGHYSGDYFLVYNHNVIDFPITGRKEETIEFRLHYDYFELWVGNRFVCSQTFTLKDQFVYYFGGPFIDTKNLNVEEPLKEHLSSLVGLVPFFTEDSEQQWISTIAVSNYPNLVPNLGYPNLDYSVVDLFATDLFSKISASTTTQLVSNHSINTFPVLPSSFRLVVQYDGPFTVTVFGFTDSNQVESRDFGFYADEESFLFTVSTSIQPFQLTIYPSTVEVMEVSDTEDKSRLAFEFYTFSTVFGLVMLPSHSFMSYRAYCPDGSLFSPPFSVYDCLCDQGYVMTLGECKQIPETHSLGPPLITVHQEKMVEVTVKSSKSTFTTVNVSFNGDEYVYHSSSGHLYLEFEPVVGHSIDIYAVSRSLTPSPTNYSTSTKSFTVQGYLPSPLIYPPFGSRVEHELIVRAELPGWNSSDSDLDFRWEYGSGSIVSFSSKPFPIRLSTSADVSIRAFKTGMVGSPVVSGFYSVELRPAISSESALGQVFLYLLTALGSLAATIASYKWIRLKVDAIQKQKEMVLVSSEVVQDRPLDQQNEDSKSDLEDNCLLCDGLASFLCHTCSSNSTGSCLLCHGCFIHHQSLFKTDHVASRRPFCDCCGNGPLPRIRVCSSCHLLQCDACLDSGTHNCLNHINFIERPLCNLCDNQEAFYSCHYCGLTEICFNCDEEVHNIGRNSHHIRSVIQF